MTVSLWWGGGAVWRPSAAERDSRLRSAQVYNYSYHHSAGWGAATLTFTFCSWMCIKWFLVSTACSYVDFNLFSPELCFSSACMRLKTVPALVFAYFKFILSLIIILNFTVAFNYGKKLILNWVSWSCRYLKCVPVSIHMHSYTYVYTHTHLWLEVLKLLVLPQWLWE